MLFMVKETMKHIIKIENKYNYDYKEGINLYTSCKKLHFNIMNMNTKRILKPYFILHNICVYKRKNYEEISHK